MFGQRGSSSSSRGEEEEAAQRRARHGETQQGPVLDAEAEAKLQQTLELLLAGGYFRARMPGLSNFDKILGGLAWAISASNVDVDLDVFSETATMGQKLKLGEAVVRSLVRMKCPYPLQTYQIKGQDWINVFPVVQWLVKKVIETRSETGDVARQYSEFAFRQQQQQQQTQQQQPPSTAPVAASAPSGELFAEELRARYKPQRRYKRHRGTKPTSQRTLLEYGHLKKRAEDERQRRDDAGEDDEDADAMASVEGAASKVAGSVVGSYMAAGDIKAAAAQYGDGRGRRGATEPEERGEGGQAFEEKMLRQKIALAGKEIERLTTTLETRKAEYAQRESEVRALEARLAKKQRLNERVRQEIAKLEQLETPENAAVLRQLRGLVALNERLKAQEATFRASCKRHMQQLREEAERRKKSVYGVSDLERIDLINETHAADVERLRKVRQLWAKKTRDVALIERKIDDVPSRAELGQFQRMFVELYGQVSSRLIETRRYYVTYNRLEDMRTCFAKEVELVEAIATSYTQATRSKSAMEKLLASMTATVKQIQQNLEKKRAELDKEKARHAELNERLKALIERDRAYFQATKDFQEECKRNEQLEAKLALVEGR